MPELYWLPIVPDWQARLASLVDLPDSEAWSGLVQSANVRLGIPETSRLDRVLQKRFPNPPSFIAAKPLRLAVLGSGTVDHLLQGIRVGALRRGIWVQCYKGDYGQYFQELMNPGSPLHAFHPDTILFAFDSMHLLGKSADHAETATAQTDAAWKKLLSVWEAARNHFGCRIIQQTILPISPSLLGQNEHRHPGSLCNLSRVLNERMRSSSMPGYVDLLSIDQRLELDGLAQWHDPGLWHRAKQEISPLASPFYGDLVGRILAAHQGRSSKCLVLDLDNTLWGGVIGDDGLRGIKLGQGSALGEAFTAIQQYARDLSKRGVVLAVCSKNDEANALAPFTDHPEMLLKRSDIACFVANWDDKAHNIRRIAKMLNLGLDSLVFVDDNPFERNIVRKELPMVAVPELPDDPSSYPRCISDGGYFESVHLTAEDSKRSALYQENQQREERQASATNLAEYLEGLKMELLWSPFDEIGLQRIVQLINKTNQFNLTTRRYSEGEVRRWMEDPTAVTLQFRLTDEFGDNGMIAVVMGASNSQGDIVIDTWLMSCRVLGRTVEDATLNIIVEQARQRNIRRIIGEYRPTEKNQMVSDHYEKIGFSPMPNGNGQSGAGHDEIKRWMLPLAGFGQRTAYLKTRNCTL
jgi:FkbH-like protein